MAGKEFRTLQYADDFVLLVKEGSVVQGIINTVTEIGRFFLKLKWIWKNTNVKGV